MVLLLATVKGEDDSKKRIARDTKFQFTTHAENIAVIYDTAAEEEPTDEEVHDALAAAEIPSSPSFFVTPYSGLIEDTDVQKHAVVTLLMTQISQCVGRRENVTIVNRGVESDQYLEQLMLTLLEAVKNSAEYAMQVVADEIAKEKQMQRLLQLENEEELRGNKEAFRAKTDSQSRFEEKPRGLPLSKSLKQKLRHLNAAYTYAQPPADRTGYQYSVLSAVHGDDLIPPCQRGSKLVPSAFIKDPPIHHQASVANRLQGRDKNTRRHSYLFNQQKRRSTMTMLAQLQSETADTDVVPLKSNGWGESVRYFVFDGESSVMALPGIPKFEEMIKSFSVDFWIRTDLKASDGRRVLFQILDGQREDLGQIFQIGINWYEEMEESIRIFCRDSTNRVLEALIPLNGTGVTLGKEFHHVALHIYSLDEGQLECFVDGKAINVQVIQQEHPIAFNLWPHRLFVGGYLDESNSPTHVFRGTLLELRFWAISDGTKPVVRWPLLVEDGKLVELTRTIPADHHETLQNLHHVEEAAPRSSPYFDGNLVLNMGTLSLWGELMQNWRLEVRFRTDVTTRMMSLVGITDCKCKMQEVGIVLNAEPVVSKERFRYHELNATFYVVDAFGLCCSALLRGTDRQNLMDGEWHTIIWRCVDSESNKFSVKVDGAVQDLLYVSREGPHRFLEFEDWVCVGGHNVRNWKVVRPFTGQLSRFFVSVRGYHFVTLHMNEGPGAYVLQDRSGHRNHGLLVSPDAGTVRKNDTLWMPALDETNSEGDAGQKMDVIIHANNNVSIAAVVFTCDFGENGVVRETVHDIFSGTSGDVEIVARHISDERPEWGTWRAISDGCFHPLETITQLEEAFNAVLAATMPLGHLMVVLRIGDCHVTLLHVRDPQLPPEAMYNTNMLKWQYPYTVEGVHGRRELMLNRMIEGMELVLTRDSMTPFTTARLGPLNACGKTVISEEIIRYLQDNGKPWFLPAVLHNYLLNAQYGSSVHILHCLYPQMSFDEAAAVALFNKSLHDGAREKASLVIQRNWRRTTAKSEAARRATARIIRDRKVEEVRTTRMNPMVQTKQNLYASIICLHNPRSGAVLPIENNTQELEDVLRRQGYEVDRVSDPSLANLARIASQVDTDKSSLLYISGYGGQLSVRQSPLFGAQSLHLCLGEGAARATICGEEGSSYRGLTASFVAEKAEIKPRKQKKGAGSAAPASKAKKMTADQIEAATRQLEAAFQSAQLEVDQEESYGRDDLMKEYGNDVQMIVRELRNTVLATKEFENNYKRRPSDHEAINYIYPCESGRIEPYADGAVKVHDLLHIILRRQAPPVGLQSIVAIDLQPVTPYSRGVACLASSTGNTLVIPYKPQQRLLFSWVLKKAFDGHPLRLPTTSKYAVLSGGIETAPNQRDWKSFASYVLNKMQPACEPADFDRLKDELDREMPFTAELIPVRDIVMTSEMKDRLRRDREAQKVTAFLTFGIGSIKVQSDMFALFKIIVEDVPLSEISFTNSVNIIFSHHNKGIDGIDVAMLNREIEKTRPSACTIPIRVDITAEGAHIAFLTQDSGDKLHMAQWLSNMVVRSMSWQIGIVPLEGSGKLEVDYIEYIYTVKTTCHMRRFRKFKKQWYTSPIPENYIRFLNCEYI